ncbi:MAG: GAF and ANTAR domain-containing protein [Deltaproteobacteria bacterium]|nr:GAF and ANTAR domain-containing protein [Deltaproteobacteria bacterium]
MTSKNSRREQRDEPSYAEQIKALSEISKAISSDHYLEDILGLIVTVTANVMGSKICSLWLLDEATKTLSLEATQSISKEYLKERVLRLGEGVVGGVAQEKKPRRVYDVLEDAHFKEKDLARKEELCSLLSVPMMVRGKVIGVINCYTSYPHRYTETEEAILTTVANQAAICIENTGLMVKTKVIQEELESRKLVERAKGILMKESKLDEAEAFGRIRKKSMDTRRSMREVAEAIILAHEIGS